MADRGGLAPDLEELDVLKGKRRVWLLFSHVLSGDEADFTAYLDTFGGRRLEAQGEPGAALYLYDLGA